ncbi:MAG: hypothetical protein JRH16_01885 [Deltaproteobacteria bacterium]|nr:hypothetical protein [Deltaproteobacteria bacterium]MBW2359292.1 hypothetical protein [Deltaproteobacteria bacterium]
MKVVRNLTIALAAYVALGLMLDASLGYFQPQSDSTVVLRSFDAEGGVQETVLHLLDDDGQLWVESGQWFRGWHDRVVANPDVELVRDGETAAYRAVPLDTPEALDRITQLMGRGDGIGYYLSRTLLLWAPIKPVRLDPKSPDNSREDP